jgi:citrate/tricarballylate utilization protein
MSVQAVIARAASETEALYAEGARIMQICNACRYCEGYCAVFPAMERRLEFDAASLAYLANLCHHCGACFYACQYAPPHEFAVNVPRTFARIRRATYEECAWPQAFAASYRSHGTAIALALAASLALLLGLAAAFVGGGLLRAQPGSFYAVFPHGLLVTVFGAAFLYACVAMGVGMARARRWSEGGAGATAAAFSLENLRGGGEGCYVRAGFDHAPERLRRWFHHATFYGFGLCFLSTALATLYHYALASPAPYPLLHPVVILGTAGGIGLVVGPAGLLWLKRHHDPVLLDEAQATLDAGFTWLLLLTSATGIALLALRDTAAMPLLLVAHLAVVLALFLTLPYGKFVHGLYRWMALSRHAREHRSSGLTAEESERAG